LLAIRQPGIFNIQKLGTHDILLTTVA